MDRDNIMEETRGHGAPPPITEDILEGPPPVAWHDFKHPALRKFPRHESKIRWLEYLGHGEEGIVYKATIGGGDPVAVKVFWRTQRPAPVQRYGGLFRELEWAFEEECRTVALIEKIKWAMQYAEADPKQIIRLEKKLETRADAFKNLRAFSDEARLSPKKCRDPALPPPFPPINSCHGWMRVERDHLPRLYPQVWKDIDEQFDWHWAIVYDYVPGELQDVAVGQAHLDFFSMIGFALEAYKFDNWRGGKLVDFGDVCSPFTWGWTKSACDPCDAKTWFKTRESVLPAVKRHRIIRSR